MRSIVAKGIVELLSPLSHGGDTEGTIRTFRREKYRQPDGTYEWVPTYSGNAFRGQLRDCGVLYMTRRLGWDDESVKPAAFYFLFTGGALSKEPGIGLDIDRARALQETIPLVGVLGGGVGRQILHGKLFMGRMVPLCRETHAFLDSCLHDEATQSVFDALQILEYTRTDDAKNPHLARYLPRDEQRRLEGPKVAVLVDGSEVARGGAQQMRYGDETLATGTRLSHEWYLNDATDLEVEAFISALYVFAQLPFIGGNARIGHGKVAVRYTELLSIEPLQMADQGTSTTLSLKPGAAYDAWIDANREEIATLLERVP